jgi:hypothetical protein
MNRQALRTGERWQARKEQDCQQKRLANDTADHGH